MLRPCLDRGPGTFVQIVLDLLGHLHVDGRNVPAIDVDRVRLHRGRRPVQRHLSKAVQGHVHNARIAAVNRGQIDGVVPIDAKPDGGVGVHCFIWKIVHHATIDVHLVVVSDRGKQGWESHAHAYTQRDGHVWRSLKVHAKLGRLRDVGGDHVETDVAVGVQLRKRDLRTTRLLLDQAVDKGFQFRAGIQAPIVKHRHQIDMY